MFMFQVLKTILMISISFQAYAEDVFKLFNDFDAFVEFLPNDSFIQCRYGFVHASQHEDQIFTDEHTALHVSKDGYYRSSKQDPQSAYAVHVTSQNLGEYGRWTDIGGGAVGLFLVQRPANPTHPVIIIDRIESMKTHSGLRLLYNVEQTYSSGSVLPSTAPDVIYTPSAIAKLHSAGLTPEKKLNTKLIQYLSTTGLFQESELLGTALGDCKVKVSVRPLLADVITSSTGTEFRLDISDNKMGPSYREPQSSDGQPGLLWGDIVVDDTSGIYTNRLFKTSAQEAENICRLQGARLPTREEVLHFAKYLGAETSKGYSTKRLNSDRDLLRGMYDLIWLAPRHKWPWQGASTFNQQTGHVLDSKIGQSQTYAQVRCVRSN